ncbi:MAG: 50S ribosomal protein L10 [Candidatus Moraniibacteriota bacterium]|jgi:large subunit ribosomal protein L10
MLTRQQKEEIVAKLTDEIKGAPSCVLADFKGLGANDMVELKKKLRSEGSTFQVIKKKLLAIALKNNGIEIDPKDYEGQIAISVSKDEVTSAKIIFETAKENENIKIVGGLLESKIMTAEEMNALAKLPTKDELRAKLLGQLQAPISGFVNTLAGVPRSFVQVLGAVRDNKEV